MQTLDRPFPLAELTALQRSLLDAAILSAMRGEVQAEVLFRKHAETLRRLIDPSAENKIVEVKF